MERRVAEVVGQDGLVPEAERAAYAVDGLEPRVVARPASIEELSALLRVADEAGAAVVPWGGGTKQLLGGIPPRVDLVVSLARLSRVVEHEPADLTASFEAGIRLADANATLGTANQWLALDPPYGDRCTLGGVLAANASGPRRLRYGTARDLVLGIRVVHADGTVTKGGAKVVKNVTGYDMNKLYIGSLGTLAVIAGVTVKLYPRPAEERTWVVPFPTLDAAAALVAKVLDSHLLPTALELISPGAARALDASAVGGPAGAGVPAGNRVPAGTREPAGTWVPAATPGPAGTRVPAGGALLAVAFGGIHEEAASQLRWIRDAVAGRGAGDERLLEGEAQEAFWDAVRNFAPRFGAMGAASQGGVPGAAGPDQGWALAKASLVLTAVPALLAAAEEARRRHGLAEVAATAEAGSGVAHVFLAGPPERLTAALRDLREVAMQGGKNAGHLVIEAAPLAVKRALDVWGPVGSSLRLMQALKQQFDPGRRLNPGRFVARI
jgi:glycolate oxidase FAD binding subunit